MTIHTTAFSLAKLKTFLNQFESIKAEYYVLIGNDLSNPDEEKVYIVEGENVVEGLKPHASGTNSKEFCKETIVFTFKYDYITKI